MNNSQNAIITQICLYVRNSNEIVWYYDKLHKNVSEIHSEVKDKDGCITSQHSRSQSKTDWIKV